MQAAIISGRGQLELRDYPDPEPAREGVVVEVRYCGICGTDVHAYAGGHPYPPELCGHEWAGRVSKVGAEVEALREGDRVSVGVLPPCGECRECRAGHPAWCQRAMSGQGGGDPCGSLHGGFASSIAASAARVVAVPDALSDEAAAQGEPATVTYHGVRRSGLRLGDLAVVQGAGPIGLLTLQWALAAGAREVVVVEPSPERRTLAGELGASLACEPGEEAHEAVRERNGGLGADCVFECVGRPETIQSAADFARRGASLALIGLSHQDASIHPTSWLVKELSVTGCIAYERAEFARCMEIMADGRVDAEPLHTRSVGLGELDAVFAELAGGSVRESKVLVDPRGLS